MGILVLDFLRSLRVGQLICFTTALFLALVFSFLLHCYSFPFFSVCFLMVMSWSWVGLTDMNIVCFHIPHKKNAFVHWLPNLVLTVSQICVLQNLIKLLLLGLYYYFFLTCSLIHMYFFFLIVCLYVCVCVCVWEQWTMH